MKFTSKLFSIITTWYAILLGNLIILALMLLSIKLSLSAHTSYQIINLRIEEISTILIAWGVVLESRKIVAGKPESTGNEKFEHELNEFAERFGVHLVALGLFLEVITYFDEDTRLELMPFWYNQTAHILEWGISVAVFLELLDGCFKIVKLRYFQTKQV